MSVRESLCVCLRVCVRQFCVCDLRGEEAAESTLRGRKLLRRVGRTQGEVRYEK